MVLDLRQCAAGILTLSMFVMLGNMVKKDNFDDLESAVPDLSNIEVPDKQFTGVKLSEKTLVKGYGRKTRMDCNHAGKHIYQVANAVVVAHYLGDTPVLPDIKGSKETDKMKFKDIYDAEKFIKSLKGVINVVQKLPAKVPHAHNPVVKIPSRVSVAYIKTHIEPTFRTKGKLNLVTYFPAVNMRKRMKANESDSVACLAMFGSLHLQPEVKELVDSMVERLQAFSEKSDGQFISMDLRVELLNRKGCQSSKNTSRRSCYDVTETSKFLKKIGVRREETIYLTQTVWHNSLDALRSNFPKLYTKGDLMPTDKRQIEMLGKSSEYEKIIDFYLRSKSDVFVPAISGLFYASVTGKRIAAGKTQILVPAQISTSPAPVSVYISPYISKKSHFEFSCFC